MAAPPGARFFSGNQSGGPGSDQNSGQSADSTDNPHHQPPAHRHPMPDPPRDPRRAGAPLDPRIAQHPHAPRAAPYEQPRAPHAPPKDPRSVAAAPPPTDPRQPARGVSPPIFSSGARMAVPPPSFNKSAVQPLKFMPHAAPNPMQTQGNGHAAPPADPRIRSVSPPIDPRRAAAGARLQDPRLARGGQSTFSAPPGAPAPAPAEHGMGGANSAEDRAAKRQRTAVGGRGGISGIPSSMLQLRGVLADWQQRLDMLSTKAKDWSAHQDFVLQLKHGLRLPDLLHERDVLEALAPRCRQFPRKCDQLLLQTWDRLASPFPELLAPDPIQSRDVTLGLLNASEVIAGFAFLSAGGRIQTDNGEGHPIASAMVVPDSPRERRDALKGWYTHRNIKYILNLAAGEPDMAGAEYPIRTVEVTGEEHERETLPVDTDDDPQVRVLRLRMEDKDDYDVKHSRELAQAAGFIERAWRRHKRACLRSHLQAVEAASASPSDHAPPPPAPHPWGEGAPPMIVIHCLGGINRSPLALIYWLARYCLDRNTSPSSHWLPVRLSLEDLWKAVKAKRRQAFSQIPEDPVLKGKSEWLAQLKERVHEEKAKLSDIDHHPALWVNNLLPLVRALKERTPKGKLVMVELDCGGLPGSPISDDEPANP